MKPRKHIRFIANQRNPEGEPTCDESYSLLQLITKAALLFTSTDNRIPEASSDTKHLLGIGATSKLDVFDDLYDRLDNTFYDTLYVDIKHAKKVIASIGFDGTIFITGYAGCGKSTLLRKLRRDRPSTAHESLTVVDVAMTPNQFCDVATCYEDLCASVYQRLFEEVAPILGKDFPAQFARFRFQHCKTHSHLREKAQADQFFTTDEDWQAALTPALLEEERTLWLSRDLSHFDRLIAILDFMRFLRHRTIIAFDNVDRLPIAVHEIIGQVAEDLGKGTGPLAHPIVCIRENNHRRLSTKSSHELTFHLGVEEVDPNAICSYTTKRLSYVLDYMKKLRLHIDDIAFVHRGGYAIPCNDMIDKFESLVLLLDDMSLLHDIYRFHNGSFRSTAIDIYHMVNSFFCNDSVFRDAEILRVSLEEETFEHKRDVRTLLYRHMVLDVPLLQELRTPDVFEVDEGSPRRSRTLLRFLPLKLLLYLRRKRAVLHPGERGERFAVSMGDILRDFAFFGTSEHAIGKVLIELAIPRKEENYGLIYVDVPMHDLPHLAVGHLRGKNVYILPSGLFFLEQLGMTCEYVFWSAMYAPLRYRLWDTIDDNKAVFYLKDDSFRAYVALRFIYTHVARETRTEIDEVVRKSQEEGTVAGMTLKERYMDIFGVNARDPTYVEGLVQRIEAFLENPATSRWFVGDGFVDSAKAQIRLCKSINQEAKVALFKPE